ncbi:MAG: BrnA antitoxin family protein [Spirochaetes bacterium]|jgi:predicted DNA binding CopG/RHH family protein|nr:BrnA antitoxin family protein [Spirochaetota bacterium]
MRKEYDFTNSIKNPYSSKLKKQITIRIDEDTINYFRTLAGEIGIPYQKLMNLYLTDCAKSHKKLKLNWK